MEGRLNSPAFNGLGVIKYPDGSTFVGELKNNKMYGAGIYTNADRTHRTQNIGIFSERKVLSYFAAMSTSEEGLSIIAGPLDYGVSQIRT